MSWIDRLAAAAAAPSRTLVGLMSGTSLDGIDAVLADVTGSGPGTRVALRAHRSFPFEGRLRDQILATIEGTTREVCELNFELGERFAEATAKLLNDARVTPAEVAAVASSGVTVWHVDRASGAGRASTLQIGEPAVIAERTGLPVIADLRVADIAAGGAGAPLVPYADWVLGARPGKVRAFQNIGGIANLTVVTESPEELFAFDTGPGNMLIDAVARAAAGNADQIDEGGKLSALGAIDEPVLKKLMGHPYLAAPPPKSTGREDFGAMLARDLIGRYDQTRLLDLLATVAAFTARSIARAYEDFVLPRTGGRLDEVIVSGGGVHNKTVMDALAAALAPIPVRPWDEQEMGFPSQAKEAVAFCVLANETIQGRTSNLPNATGASRPVVLGKIVPATGT